MGPTDPPLTEGDVHLAVHKPYENELYHRVCVHNFFFHRKENYCKLGEQLPQYYDIQARFI